MRLHPNWDAFNADTTPGGFYFADPTPENNYRMLWLHLPHGCRCVIHLIPLPAGFQKRDDKGVMRPASWDWNGNREAPTLRPSLRYGNRGDDYYWHGWIQLGVLKGC